MKDFRNLTAAEIDTMKSNGCTAEDWSSIFVAQNFTPDYVRRVNFYGKVHLGVFDKTVEVAKGFSKHTGIFNATLREVSVGDNCLIENIGNYIHRYDIEEECQICNVSTIETTEESSFGQGNVISILNEVGKGNLMLFNGLTSQLAQFMVQNFHDEDLMAEIKRMINKWIANYLPERGTIGDHVIVRNTTEIINTLIAPGGEVKGACRLYNCTIQGLKHAPVYIGSGVICENSIIFDGSSIRNSAKIQDCFVGECCEITNGFTAAASVFFANSYMANGEACAAFCGPFTASHHKSSLLIGGMFSFYNAGSATNFSNHAYKMGPVHYGTMQRGCKTASGAYLLMPANIGTFSVCFGKLMYHPDTRSLPFSYLIAYNDSMYMVPGRNITTVGLYRDIRKWPKRDARPSEGQKSIVNFDWLSPFSVGEILEGKRILESLKAASGGDVSTYNYHEYVIKASSLKKGIKYYDISLRIFMGALLKRHRLEPPKNDVGLGPWIDLGGMLMPQSEEKRLIDDIKRGVITSIEQVLDRFQDIHAHYSEYRWTWGYRMMLEYYGLERITEADAERIRNDYVQARRAWIAEIKKDAEKEYSMGDVEDDVLSNFITQLDKEIDFENTDLTN